MHRFSQTQQNHKMSGLERVLAMIFLSLTGHLTDEEKWSDLSKEAEPSGGRTGLEARCAHSSHGILTSHHICI